MKTKMSDVRAHLVAVMEMLTDEDRDHDKAFLDVERAKAMSQVAREYTANAKLELDAVRMVSNGNLFKEDLPAMIGGPEQKPALEHKQ